MKKIALLVFITALASISCYSQSLSYTAIEQDATSSAMGGSDIVASTAFAALGNASLVPLTKEKVSVGTSYTNWAPSSFNYFNFGTSVKVDKDGKYALSAAVSSGKGNDYETMDEIGAPTGMFTPTELSLFGGFSALVKDNISVGASVGYLRQVLYDRLFNTSVAASAFMSILLSDYTVTFGVKSLGNGTPTSINFGGKWNKDFDEDNSILLAAESNIYIDGNASLSAGAQYSLMNILSLRTGFRYGGKSVIPSYGCIGAGLCFDGVHIDFAYLIANKVNSPGNTINIGLRFEL